MEQARKQSNGLVRGYDESSREYALRVELSAERLRVARLAEWRETKGKMLGFRGVEFDEIIDAPVELLRKRTG
jgi:hypothetical protein